MNQGGRLVAGRYRLLSVVGQGGMGTVWRAHDEVLSRDVAVKEVLLPAGLPDRERSVVRERMFREARTAARLSHPAVVTIYDVVEEDDRPWIVMELVRARSLDEVIKSEGVLPAGRTAEMGVQMLGALRVAHEAGVLHRDVKPSNVLVTEDDRVVLTDFGIATASGEATITQTGMVLGSPAYIAPERARGKQASPASDLWSLGVTLYAMAEGRSPFERTDAVSSLAAVLTDEHEPARRSGAVRPVIDGLLRKDPESRMTSAEALPLLEHAAAAAQPPVPTVAEPAADAEATEVALEAGPVTQPAGSAVRTTTDRAPRRVPTGPRRPLLVVLAIVAAVLTVAGVRALSGDDDDGRPGSSSAGTAKPSKTPTRQQQPDLRTHKDRTGFSIGVPRGGWKGPRRAGSSVFFDGPDGSLIQVDQTNTPGPDARADWVAQEKRQRGGDFPGYRRVRMKDIDYKGSKTAADWEFTWNSQRHGRRHGLNRGFVLNGRGYAIFIVTKDSGWKRAAGWRDGVYESFKPAG